VGSAFGLSNAEYLRLLRVKAKEQGLCVQCRARPKLATRTCCEVCAEKGVAHAAKMKKQKRCKCGGKRKRGRAQCARCIRDHAIRSARRRFECKQQGICWRCAQPVVPGHSACRPCLDHEAARMRKWSRS
jgi:hypothetical protein